MKKGIFITFEGGEACGKSSQIKLLKEYLLSLPNPARFVFVREPGGTPLGEEIRNMVMKDFENAPLPMSELLLYCASRAELVERVIRPALQEGKIVIADRFYDSTIAYQGMARKIMSAEDILKLTRMIIGQLTPDLTFYLKIAPEEAFKRKANMNEQLDRIELEGMEFHQNVAKGYDYISKLEPQRFFVIDATKSIDEIAQIIKDKVNNLIN